VTSKWRKIWPKLRRMRAHEIRTRLSQEFTKRADLASDQQYLNTLYQKRRELTALSGETGTKVSVENYSRLPRGPALSAGRGSGGEFPAVRIGGLRQIMPFAVIEDRLEQPIQLGDIRLDQERRRVAVADPLEVAIGGAAVRVAAYTGSNSGFFILRCARSS